jgi:hypothetical protein
VALTQYQQDVQRYLHDPNATYFSLTDLTRYINLSRRYVAIKSQSVRVLLSGGTITSLTLATGGSGYIAGEALSFTFTNNGIGVGAQAQATGTVVGTAVATVTLVSGGWGYFVAPTVVATGGTSGAKNATFTVTVDNSCSTVAGQEVYQFSTFNVLAQNSTQFPGVQAVCGIFSVACSQGGTYKPMLTPCTWTEFQAYLRIYQNQAQNYPVYWSQYGQGIGGSFYLFPWPSQVLQMDIDAWCIPVDLTSDSTPEAIPLPFSDAVAYFAAYLALVDAQRMADANEMKARADVYLQFSRAGVDSPFVPDYYGGM